MFFGIFVCDERRSSAIQFRQCRAGLSDSDDNSTMASLRALRPGRESLVAVHVAQLFSSLLFGAHVEIAVTALPELRLGFRLQSSGCFLFEDLKNGYDIFEQELELLRIQHLFIIVKYVLMPSTSISSSTMIQTVELVLQIKHKKHPTLKLKTSRNSAARYCDFNSTKKLLKLPTCTHHTPLLTQLACQIVTITRPWPVFGL